MSPRNDKKPSQSVSLGMQASRSELWHGPIPPPQTLEKYENILPGAADRILQLAEDEAQFRRVQSEQINKALAADMIAYRKEVSRGQLCGLSVALGGLIASLIAAYLGATAIGVTVGGTCLVGLVTAFLGSRRGSEPPQNH